MDQLVNQAVLFTKPVHHLGIDLTPEQLDRQLLTFLKDAGFRIISTHEFAGNELAARSIVRNHYLMYSKGSYGDVVPCIKGRERFFSTFGKEWESELAAGRIMGNPQLMKNKGIDERTLFSLWNPRFISSQTHKIDPGLVIGWIDELESYVINGFYPTMEAKFNNPKTKIDYHVVEFDPATVSWGQFRKKLLGATDASKADPDSFRGQLFSQYSVEFPAADNFTHGSAGPLEGLIERINFEPDFEMHTNPVGRHLVERGVTLEQFKIWKNRQPIFTLGNLFDITEEKNITEVFQTLESITWNECKRPRFDPLARISK